MTEALEIYSDFYEIEPNDSLGIIRLYEKNKFFLDNKSNFKDKDDFNDLVLFTGQYVISLEKMGKYSKAIKYAEKLLQLIDSKKEEFNINLMEFTTYWSILTTIGRSFYNLKDYKNSVPIFEKLLEWDSDNDYFKNWLNASKSEKRNAINKYLYSLAFILFITSFTIESRKTEGILIMLGFIIAFTGTINEYFGDKIISWLRK
jgi:tetratricopeptide (TPR) repeat protein